MDSDEVSTQDIQLPSSEDFIAVFGCDYAIQDEMFQKYEFEDECGGTAKLTFGFVDGSFGLSIFQESTEVLKIYDEYLSVALINEADQSISITLQQGRTAQTIKFKPWPRMAVSIENMR
ncbi:MAG: hypothetical protein ABJL11_17650 [Parasphingorhabdus sp.]